MNDSPFGPYLDHGANGSRPCGDVTTLLRALRSVAMKLVAWIGGICTLVACGGSTAGTSTDAGPADVQTTAEDVQGQASCDGGAAAGGQLSPPRFDPPDGTTFTGSGSVTVELCDAPAGAQIFYTTNGSVPSCTGPSINCTGNGYAGPIAIDQKGQTTIWAVVAAPGSDPSPPAHAIYTVQ